MIISSIKHALFPLCNPESMGKVLNTNLRCNYNSLLQSFCKAFRGIGNS